MTVVVGHRLWFRSALAFVAVVLAVPLFWPLACASNPPARTADAGSGATDPGLRPAPFGSRPLTYPSPISLPSRPLAELDAAVTSFYDRWKAAYVASGCGGRYVKTGGGTGAKDAITVSEGHGYGMILAALMHGHDPEARALFDDFHAVYRRFPSAMNRDLMAWAIGPNCAAIEGPNSATDGDLDIAFALLLANRQWGSAGTVDYLGEAKRIISAIATSDLNSQTRLPLLGDWARTAKYYQATRPSDFMPDHLRAFAAVSHATAFSDGVEQLYDTAARVQMSAAPTTGLLPDFVIDAATTPRPAPPDFLEGPHDGAYFYNACRVPWRIGTDAVVSGDPRARALLMPMNAFIKRAAAGDPAKISAGYRLDGVPLGNEASGAFIAPFAVAAMVVGDRPWLDAIWDWMVQAPLDDYYADSLRLLSMIVVAGHWWAP